MHVVYRRRKQLRKLVDEGGQTSVGGPMPSHPVLSKWQSYEFGVTDEEITGMREYLLRGGFLLVDDFRNRGFTVGKVEEHPQNYDQVAKLSYGPKAVAAAAVVRGYFLNLTVPGGCDI